jgi:hypothetical protein
MWGRSSCGGALSRRVWTRLDPGYDYGRFAEEASLCKKKHTKHKTQKKIYNNNK